MITLTGLGGIGKTKLALEVARGLLPNFHGAGVLVELASLTQPGLVPSTVANVLSLQLSGQEISATSVARAIGDKRLLLILDNCEHVIDAAAELAEVVIRMCPLVSILATSRELLRIDGECSYRVQPLDVPPLALVNACDVLRHTAARLFVARIDALGVTVGYDDGQLRAIATICRHLDGIPLAIELAAARASTLGLEQTVLRLNDRFGLLTSGRRAALPRQQTLRATLDWSYELLSVAQQYLFRNLAVFAGGFTLDAASALVGGGADINFTVHEEIANLVAKSLVTLDESEHSSRWRLLETTRAYALERLENNDEGRLAARRHAELFRDLVTADLSSPAHRHDRQRLSHYGREIDNVRAALDWAFSGGGDMTVGVELTAAYVPVWLHLSFMAECRASVARALEWFNRNSSISARVKMQLDAALGVALMNTMGSVATTGIVLKGAMEAAESLNDSEFRLQTLWAMWTFLSNNGEKRAALDIAQKFGNVASLTADPTAIIVGHRLIGNSLHYLGNQAASRQQLEQVLTLCDASDDRQSQIWFHYDQRVLARAMLARVLSHQGIVDQAMRMAKASLDDAISTNHKESLCYALGESVCHVALLIGYHAYAKSFVTMLVEVATRYGLDIWMSLGHCLEGKMLMLSGDVEGGLAAVGHGLKRFRQTGRALHYVEFLGVLAEGLCTAGRIAEGLATISEALERSGRYGERWCISELLRVKGELVLRNAGSRAKLAAAGLFLEAIDEARKQGALMWELRAALSLSRLYVLQNEHNAARFHLAPLCRRFPEGVSLPDLCSARALLATLP
jgi:predicted ATPase